MSAKPGTQVVWNSGATDMTTPSAGQQTDGVADGDILTAGIFDFLVYWLSQWTTYLADGIIQHATKTHQVAAATGEADDPFFAFLGGMWQCNDPAGAANKKITLPINLEVGQRITAVRSYIRDTNVAVAGAVTMAVWSRTASGSPVQLGTDQVSAGDGTFQTLTVTGLTTTIVTGSFYYITLNLPGVALANVVDTEIRLAEIDHDRLIS